MMKLRDILRSKGSQVHTISPSATLQDVANVLVRHNCGSLLVTDGDQLCGIITERDILRAAASHQPLVNCLVRDHMTVELVTGSPDESLSEVMGQMSEHRIRHLPILEDGRLVGIISIVDVVKAQHDQLSMENHYLKNYIQG
jgi:CBS domain-containing protein